MTSLRDVADDAIDDFHLSMVLVVKNQVSDNMPPLGLSLHRRQFANMAMVIRPAENDLVQHLLGGEPLHQRGTLLGVVCGRVEFWVVGDCLGMDLMEQTVHFVGVGIGIMAYKTKVSALDQEIRPPTVAGDLIPTLPACLLDGVSDAALQRILTEAIELLILDVWAKLEGKRWCLIPPMDLGLCKWNRNLVVISNPPTHH